MNNKKGLTLIEGMIAMILVSVAIVGGMQYYKKKMEQALIAEFEYDMKKTLKGFEEKLIMDNLTHKDVWRNFKFSDTDYRNHLKHNLIDRDSRCADNIGHPEIEKDYMPCYLNLNFNQFQVNFEGEVKFNQDDHFRSYNMTFTPKNKKGFQKIKSLEKALMRSFNDVDFYSDVYFYSEGYSVPYTTCIQTPEDCVLRMSFGTIYEYLDEEIIRQETVEQSWNQIGSDRDYSTNPSYDGGKESTKGSDDMAERIMDNEFSFDSIDEIKRFMAAQGMQITDKEARQMLKEMNKLKNDPKFMSQMEEQLELNCSQYDEDDYYYMELYDQNHICYRYKNEGLN